MEKLILINSFLILFQFGTVSHAASSCRDLFSTQAFSNVQTQNVISFPTNRVKINREFDSQLNDLIHLYTEYLNQIKEMIVNSGKSLPQNPNAAIQGVFENLKYAIKEWTTNTNIRYPNQNAVTQFVNQFQLISYNRKAYDINRLKLLSDGAELTPEQKALSQIFLQVYTIAEKIKNQLETEFSSKGLSLEPTKLLLISKDTYEPELIPASKAKTDALEIFTNRLSDPSQIPAPTFFNSRLNYEKYLIQTQKNLNLERARKAFVQEYWDAHNAKKEINPDYKLPFGQDIPFPNNLKYPGFENSDRQFNEKSVGGYKEAGLYFPAKGSMQYQKLRSTPEIYKAQIINDNTVFNVHAVSLQWPNDKVFYVQHTVNGRPEMHVTKAQFNVTIHGNIEVVNYGKKIIVTENLDTPVNLEKFFNQETNTLDNFSWTEPKQKLYSPITGLEVERDEVQKKMSYDGKILKIQIPSDIRGSPSLYTAYSHERWLEIEVDPSLTDFKSIQIKMGVLDNKTNTATVIDSIQTTSAPKLYAGVRHDAKEHTGEQEYTKLKQLRSLLDFLKPIKSQNETGRD